MKITGKTRLLGIIGYPLTYTISPQIHNAALDAAGVDARYLPMVVQAHHLKEAVEGLKALDILGVNVTMPHKEATVRLLDRLDESAHAIGAVNTIAFEDRASVGHNTDALGFLASLREAGFEAEGKRSVVVGAGGAARAVVSALASIGARVSIINRTKERGDQLAAAIKDIYEKSRLEVVEFGGESADRVKDAELIVNATPIGMSGSTGETPLPAELFRAGQLVYDLIYEPAETRLLREAAERGARTMGGLSMLVHQAAASFEIWTGVPAPLAVMKDAAVSALEIGS